MKRQTGILTAFLTVLSFIFLFACDLAAAQWLPRNAVREAERVRDGWLVSGRKTPCSLARQADLVFARKTMASL